MKKVYDSLEVSQSNLTDQKDRTGSEERRAYQKADDADLLPAIRALVDARSSYAYRRIHRLLARQRVREGKDPV